MDMTGMGIVMWIFWVVVFIAVVLLIKVLISSNNKQISSSSQSPIETLKKRYANGDIDDEEYERRKKELEV
jgi:putative membrane protein